MLKSMSFAGKSESFSLLGSTEARIAQLSFPPNNIISFPRPLPVPNFFLAFGVEGLLRWRVQIHY